MAPRSAKCVAIVRPTRRAAPVTSATLPLSSIALLQASGRERRAPGWRRRYCRGDRGAVHLQRSLYRAQQREVVRMAGLVRDDAAQDWPSQQVEVADHVEHLMAREFVGKAQRRVNHLLVV